MSYAMLAQFGLGLVNGYLQTSAQKGFVKAQKTIDKANAKAANIAREGENEKRAAANALANYTKSINNQRLMRSTGEQVEALALNFGRMLDQSVKGNIADQVRASEELGRLSAQAAWSGVGGSTSAMIEQTLRLRQSSQAREREVRLSQQGYEYGKQREQLISRTGESLDYRYELAGLDYGVNLAPYRAEPNEFAGALAGADFSLLRDALAGIKPTAQKPTTSFQSFRTPVTSPSFGNAVSADFFSINSSGVGVNLL